jgi:DNA-binding protein HU-beta
MSKNTYANNLSPSLHERFNSSLFPIMSKHALISAISAKAGTSQATAEAVINQFAAYIISQVKKGESVQVYGLGKFTHTDRAARNGVNPKTLEKIRIPAMKSPRFVAAKQFKDAVR